MKRLRKRKKQNNFAIIKESFLKIVAVFVIIGLNWTGLSAIGKTFAYFNDTETSLENNFSAGILDVELDPVGVYVSGLMYPSAETSTSINFSSIGSIPVKYSSKILALTANTEPCDYVGLTATDGTQTYSGHLLDFTSVTDTLEAPVNWNYMFTIDSSAPPAVWGKTCYFKWVFTAWDRDMTEPNNGFIDIEEKSGGVKIGKVIVLNEIFANPIGSDDAPKPNGEWVELYNNGNIDFDVNGWAVYDSDDENELYITAGNTNTENTIVPAHGFLVVYRNGDSDFTIDNSDETIRLYTGYPVSSSVLIDSYSYSEEKPEGFSYARIPDGVGDWVDPVPTPGESNVLEKENFEPGEEAAEELEILEIVHSSESSEVIIPVAGENTSMIINEVFISGQFVAIPTEEESAPELKVDETIESAEEIVIGEELIAEEVIAEEEINEETPVDVPDNDSGQSDDSGNETGEAGSPADIISE